MIHYQGLPPSYFNQKRDAAPNLCLSNQFQISNLMNTNIQIINPATCSFNMPSSNSHQMGSNQVTSQSTLLNQIKIIDKSSQSGSKRPAKTQIKKMFTNEEDQKLIDAVGKLRYQNGFCWSQVSEIVGGGRTPRQCRERYKHYLDPEIKNAKWTIEEEILLEQKYAEYGPKWSIISKFFKSRTDVNVKNHWTILSQRIQKVLNGNYKNFSIPYVKTLNRLSNVHSKRGIDTKNKPLFNPLLHIQQVYHSTFPSHPKKQSDNSIKCDKSNLLSCKVQLNHDQNQQIQVLDETRENQNSNLELNEVCQTNQDETLVRHFNFGNFDDDLSESIELNELQFNQNKCFYSCSCNDDYVYM